MPFEFKTSGVCARLITLDLDDNLVHNVKIYGGCPGQSQALPKLVEGMSVEEITNRLKGIRCGTKSTSCADQLVQAVNNAYVKSKKANLVFTKSEKSSQ